MNPFPREEDIPAATAKRLRSKEGLDNYPRYLQHMRLYRAVQQEWAGGVIFDN